MKAHLIIIITCCLVLLVSPRTPAETIPRDVVASGGGRSTNADYELLHTVGQPVAHLVTGADYVHEQGFWYLPWFFATPVDEEDQVPKAYRLDQNYPNPFNPVTTIRFALVQRSHVRLTIYNAAGRVAMTVLNREMDPGEHRVELRAAGLASGVYFYRLTAGRFVTTKKMVVLR